MGRAIAGLIVGYFVMFALVFLTFSGAYLAMGADGAFRPGTYDVSALWTVVSFALGLLAAVAGGWLSAVVGRDRRAVIWLAGLVVVLGLAQAGMVARAGQPDPGPRAPTVGNLEAMSKARTPLWAAVVNPLVGAAGVMIGGQLAGRRQRVIAG